MKNKLFTGLLAATLAATVALAPPVFARGPGGGGFGGGMHAGGFGGGMRGGGAMAFAPAGGGGRFVGANVGGARFVGAPMTRAAFAPGARFAGAGFHHGRFFHHHRFNRFAFVGAPFFYANYANYYDDGCWRRSLTPYGWQWVNVCGDYW